MIEASINTNNNESNQSDINTSSLEVATTPNGEEGPAAVQQNDDDAAAAEKRRLSTFDAVMHIIKGNLGPGILNLPYAFATGGYLYSSILFVIVVFQGLYSMCLLVYCKYLLQQHFEALRQEKLDTTPMTIDVVTSSKNSNRSSTDDAAIAVEEKSDTNVPLISYGDVANATFGTKGRWVVNFFAFTMQFGVCCAFLGLMSTNLTAQTGWSMYISEGIITVALLFLVLVRHLKDIKWFSSFANILMLLAVGTAIVAAIIQIVRYDSGNNTVTVDDANNVAANTQTKQPTMFPDTISAGVQFITSIFFAFEGMALVLPIEKAFSMGYKVKADENKASKRFGFLTLYSMTFVGCLFYVTGITNSIAFPDVSSGSITAYLRVTFPKNIWYDIVNIFETVAVFLTFSLQMTPPNEILDCMIDGGCGCFKRSSPTSCWGKYNWIVTRYILVLFCYGANMIFGNDLSLLISFFGAAGQTNLAMIPCIIYLKLQHMRIAPRNMAVSILNGAIIVFCSCAMVAGIAFSVMDVIKAFENP
jgi:proton-coupled amino acid transporter